jgi:prepilin-type N-terminal cleavage/methylation domain-containing protein
MMRNRGFTLLEILLSLTIIAVLGLVFIATTQKIQERNQIRIAASQMNAITNAAIDYYKMYAEWPTTVPTLSPLLGQDLSCSVWKNASGCTTYKITSTANSHYFALAVTPPNMAIAANLVTQLPSAYQSSTTVTTYATTFSGFKVQAQIPPPGVLLTANGQQLNGSCAMNTKASGGPYPNPFANCVSASSTPTKSYGLIDLYNQPKGSIVSQNVFAVARGAGGTGASFSNNAAPTCPGMIKTMIFLPVGARTTIASNGSFRYMESHFTNQLQATFNYFVGNAADTTKNANIGAGVGDILCLPAGTPTPSWGS